MMKKLLLIALCLLLSLGTVFAARAEDNTDKRLQGLITQVGEGYFLMQDETLGEVRVNLDDALTVYDGIAAKDTLAPGQYVLVGYNGVMTRSLPPQVTALTVGCYVLHGIVTEILDNGCIVEGDSVVQKAIVHLGDGFPPVYLGVPVTVYYGGVMALSMPPQISALHVVVPSLFGTAAGVSDSGFTLTTPDGGAYTVSVDSATRFSILPAEGQALRVYYNGTVDMGTKVTALEVAAFAPAQVATP